MFLYNLFCLCSPFLKNDPYPSGHNRTIFYPGTTIENDNNLRIFYLPGGVQYSEKMVALTFQIKRAGKIFLHRKY
jgi:hypothetical protein